MKGAVINIRLESHTSNTSSWHARTQQTHKFLTRESVIAAVTRTDWMVQEREKEYDPDAVYGDSQKFHATPAMPVEIKVRKAEVGGQMKKTNENTKPQEHLLAYGHREFLAPGSKFRAIVWDGYPKLQKGDIVLIGKERADAVIELFNEYEIEETGHPEKIHDIELLKIPRNGEGTTEMDRFVEKGNILRTSANTQRYSIIIGETEKYLKIGEWCIPAVKGVTTK